MKNIYKKIKNIYKDFYEETSLEDKIKLQKDKIFKTGLFCGMYGFYHSTIDLLYENDKIDEKTKKLFEEEMFKLLLKEIEDKDLKEESFEYSQHFENLLKQQEPELYKKYIDDRDKNSEKQS